MALRRTALLVAGLLAVVATPVLVSGAAPAVRADRAPRYLEYVALGDSWSADVVLVDRSGLPDRTHVPIDCFQSHSNYPKLVAAALSIPVLRDATCGSATTEHFTQPQELPLGGTNPPQFDRLTPTTDLVTVGIGGNDAAAAAALTSCISASPVGTRTPALPLPDVLPLLDETAIPLGACKERYTEGGVDRLARKVDAAEDKVIASLKAIKQRSPRARVLLVNYLDAIPQKGCWPIVPITDPDMAYLHSVFARLNDMLASAARRGGAELVDTHPLSTGHHLCTGPLTRYVEGIGLVSLTDPAVALPVHPNAAGARSQARSVLAQIRR